MARVYAVASSKGGVGKTTTTANLSATLAAADYDVAVVDGDIGMANLGNQLGIDGDGPTLHDVLAGSATPAEATYEGPHGISVVPGDTALTAFGKADVTQLGGVLGSLADRDFVFVDTGAGLSHETALPLGLADEVILVSTAERDSLGDTEKTRELANRLGVDVVGVVLTRVAEVPESTAPLEAPVLGTIPEDAGLPAASDVGLPITLHDPDAPAAAAYRGVASTIADGPIRPPIAEQEGSTDADAETETEAEAEPEAEAEAEPEVEAESRADAEPERAAEPVDDNPAEDATPTDDADGGVTVEPREPAAEATDTDGEQPAADQTADTDDRDEPIQEAESSDEDEAIPFASEERSAPLVEEQEDDGDDDDGKKGFLRRLFS